MKQALYERMRGFQIRYRRMDSNQAGTGMNHAQKGFRPFPVAPDGRRNLVILHRILKGNEQSDIMIRIQLLRVLREYQIPFN